MLDRDGKAPQTADAQYVIFRSLDGTTNGYGQLDNGHFTGQLAPGEYVVEAGVSTPEPGGGKSLTVVYLPRFVLDQDRTVVLDAREGRPMSIDVDRPDARLTGGDGGGGYARVVQTIGGETTTTANIFLNGQPTYITPSGPAPGLRLLLQGRLTKDGAVTGSPYIYNVAGSASDQDVIPSDPALRVRTADLATVNTRYARQGRPACAGTHAGAHWPGGGFTTGFYVGVGSLPATRTEYFSPGADWETDTDIGADCDLIEASVTAAPERFPRAGTYTRDRTTGPLGAGADFNTLLSDGTLQFWVPMLSSWDAHSGIAPYDHVTGQTTLQTSDRKIIATSDQPGYGEFNLPAPGRGSGQAAYKVTTDAERQAPWSDLATRQHVVWTFTAQPPSGDRAEDLPLLSVLYRTRLDDDNRASTSTQHLALSVRTNQDAPTPTVRRLTLRASYDDGTTWKNVPVYNTGQGWEATLQNPPGSAGKYVSLRAAAEDTTGRTVDQTVIHAYGLAP
ncbi:hypothetical protein AB0L00_00500 [Actinoallomurus sp. NPDC052308]|uniref:hypothetical protein n=1 Tax=Actinoallomurus sp. NPDC052308 TaxID=3155530 RepID=UPI0034121F2F